MKNKIISMILVLFLAFSLSAFARVSADESYFAEAEQLKTLGVFQGTGSGFELTRQPTRLEGLIMLIRLLGKENEAESLANNACVFTDVPDWGKGYVNYAYAEGLTNGIGDSKFGSYDNMNALGYTTFMLRALGYQDSAGDFTYTESIRFAEQIGMYSAADLYELSNNTFLRDHVAKVSMLALGTKVRSGDRTLLDKLINDGVITEAVADQINTDASKSLAVHYIDVGQADAILIIKGEEAMLIDGGNEADASTVVNYIKSQNISTIKYLIATHPHEDHIGGLAQVIRSFNVENIIMPDVFTTTQTFEDLLSAIAEKGREVTRPVYGNSYDFNGAAFTILAPNSSAYSELNDYSVVIKLVNGSNSFLFTGDAEELSESEMLARNSGILKSDVLKIGHHGGGGSTSQAFLNAAAPTYAVISVGADNLYGHPDRSALDKLAAKSIKLFRTDEQGDIVATCNGHIIVFNNQPVEVSAAAPGDSAAGSTGDKSVIISGLDKKAELITIKNTGEADVNLAGWVLLSVTGNQRYTFSSITLKAGGALTVASGGAAGDLIWLTGYIWNNSDSDPAELYDANGNLISTYAD